MTDFVTYRETVEFTVQLSPDGFEDDTDGPYFGEDRRDVKVISREEIGRRHEPDYVLDCDMKAGLYRLLKDGERVFAHRSHDAVLEHAASLGEKTSHMARFGDLDDPEKSWDVMAEIKAASGGKAQADSGS
ncbi:hypothetical protein [Pseudarthrobacter sp. BIM B-2242]|uniref:hypothetical protein n=1 Tax=Pseudarthrobacter sp. BIM B-2242 TaxID=2772401 RepID=UPI00168B53EA|nr:hypothetical protein [Pseudarthrobacter sp. BIM B-2242]QOD06057.1 hypothetical protein IDT60_21065 [Pseudarthrobacter sp. BIM B-2242]